MRPASHWLWLWLLSTDVLRQAKTSVSLDDVEKVCTWQFDPVHAPRHRIVFVDWLYRLFLYAMWNYISVHWRRESACERTVCWISTNRIINKFFIRLAHISWSEAATESTKWRRRCTFDKQLLVQALHSNKNVCAVEAYVRRERCKLHQYKCVTSRLT